MSRIKEWFLTHIDEFSDEELLKEGYSQEEIDFLKRRDIKNEKESAGLFGGQRAKVIIPMQLRY
ncbi:MAG: hypothetical protein BHV89_11070 [Clostridiales bacterium 41_21_two_genomes]|nr:MAG: hypothetical protein BHV89_11070 [Clostridiales bacterium 41_21_two_genomes]